MPVSPKCIVALLLSLACGPTGPTPPPTLKVTTGAERKVIASGELAFDFKNIPRWNLGWRSDFGSGIANKTGVATVDYTTTKPDGTAGAAIDGPRLIGANPEAFIATLDTSIAFSFTKLIYIVCAPPSAGVFEAILSTKVNGEEGEHQVRLRCEAAAGYAMVPGETSGVTGDGADVLMKGGASFNRATQVKKSLDGTQWPYGAYSVEFSNPSRDGSKIALLAQDPLPNVTPPGDYRLYGVNLAGDTSMPLPLLTADEALLARRNETGVPWLSSDGNVLTFTNRTTLFQKDLTTKVLKPFVPATSTTSGTYAVQHVSTNARFVYYSHGNQSNVIDFSRFWVLDAQTGTSAPIRLVDSAGLPIAGAPTVVTEVTFTDDLQQMAMLSSNQGVSRFWVYNFSTKSLRPVFEDAIKHVRSIAGGPGTIMIAGFLRFGFKGRYLTTAIQDWKNATYWAGSKMVYVADLETNKTYAFGVLPDRTLITGDGWFYQSAGVAEDGSAAFATVAWTAGVGGAGDGVAPFTLFVPRDQWVEIPKLP